MHVAGAFASFLFFLVHLSLIIVLELDLLPCHQQNFLLMPNYYCISGNFDIVKLWLKHFDKINFDKLQHETLNRL